MNKYLEKIAELTTEQLQDIWGNAHWHTSDDIDAATNLMIEAGISPEKAFNMSNRQLRAVHGLGISNLTDPVAAKPGRALAGVTTGIVGALGGAVLGKKLMGEPGVMLGALTGLIGGGAAGSSAYNALRREAYDKADEVARIQALSNLEKFKAKVEALGPPAGADKELLNRHSGNVVNHNINYEISPYYW